MTIRARPFVAKPPPAGEWGFYEDEQAEFDRIFGKPYEMIDEGDTRWLLNEGEVFVPADYLRYFAPALAENAQFLAAEVLGEDYMERLGRVLQKASPLQQIGGIAADLRKAIARAPIRGRYVLMPEPWATTYPAGYGFARLLLLVLELEGASEENRMLLESEDPAIQLVAIELARGLVEGGWTIPDVATANLLSADLIVHRLERAKTNPNQMVSLAARFVLGEVAPDEMPVCGDPSCPVHRGGGKRHGN